MDDLSTVIWIALAAVWLLMRLFRRGARAASGRRQGEAKPQVSRQPPPRQPPPPRPLTRPDRLRGASEPPPPIEPR